MNMKAIRIISWAAIAVLVASFAGILTYQQLNKGSDNSLMADVKVGAPFELVDHRGEPITEAAINGAPAAVFFGFTHCPEVCPTSLFELAAWLDELGEAGNDINAFFVTIDPERDTPDIMRAYIESFSDRITGITGDREKIDALAKSWFVFAQKVPLDDGDYTMDHTASIFLVDAEGRLQSTIAFGEDSETAKEKLRRLGQG